MACLTENQIVEFFSPGRSAEIADTVDAHSATCERCRKLLAEYAQLSSSLMTSHLGVPSLTASGTSNEERLELVLRLAQAQAKKHIGTVVKNKWTIEELLGAGGMAYVFAARHRNGRRVAIKCMRPELVLERTLVERFLREGYVANKIHHPNAVAILDDDVMPDGTPFLVMELLTGKTLRQRLESGPLPLGDALSAIAQVLDLLATAHDKGILHRDLKPDNLFATDDGAIKVLDFGIARLKEHARPDFETRSGTTMGTVGYMPPEQARGLSSQIDARSDVWAIGATLFSLITGRPVHEAATTNEALLLAMTKSVPPMRTLLPGAPSSIQALLDKALAFDKQDRYPSARAMKEALDAAMLRLDDAGPPTRTRAFWVAGIGVMAAAGGALGFVLANEHPAQSRSQAEPAIAVPAASSAAPPASEAKPEAQPAPNADPKLEPPPGPVAKPTQPVRTAVTRSKSKPKAPTVASSSPEPDPAPEPAPPPTPRDPLGPRE